jgi:3'-phosphoadenosine 5'-phosphosulfate sulfotransferase (PAPS reductase)/FAD synthetase
MKSQIKHIICYSGGQASAIVAIEAARRYGKKNIILLNHDINPRYENADIKRFKREVADYIGIKITYANIKGIKDPNLIPSQFEVCEEAGSFINPHNRQILCTHRLKTQPFYAYLETLEKEFICVYYGFDGEELERVDRRKTILNDEGITSDFPIALWGNGRFEKLLNYLQKTGAKNPKAIAKIENYQDKDSWQRTIFSTTEIGIEPPNTYNVWKHANCIGCLKAGKQHWYCVYVHDYETYERGKLSEKTIGYSIHKEAWLKGWEKDFEKMKLAGVPANEHIPAKTFWKSAKRFTQIQTEDLFPCQCFV